MMGIGWPDKEFEGRRDSTLHAVVADFGKNVCQERNAGRW